MRNLWKHFVPYGDSWKAMEAVYRLAYLDDPPLHIPLGKDAVGGVLRTELARWRCMRTSASRGRRG